MPISEQKIAAIISRVKGIILDPTREWGVITLETTTIKDLLLDYVMILAAIPALAIVFGVGVFSHYGFGVALRQGIAGYIGAIASFFITGYVLTLLVNQFQHEKNQLQAFKIAAYSATPYWIAGVFLLIPVLSILALLAAFYALYVMYCGLKTMIKATTEQAFGYIIAIFLAFIVVAILLRALT